MPDKNYIFKTMKNESELFEALEGGPIKELLGRIVRYQENKESFVIVGNNEFKEMSAKRYSDFIQNIIKLESEHKEMKKSLQRSNIKIATHEREVERLNDALKARSKLNSPKVERTLKFMATRFAIRVMKTMSEERTLEIIDHAVKQMLEFVQHFNQEETDCDSHYEEEDFYPIAFNDSGEETIKNGL